MADATFDGVNLIITLPSGEAIVDVETDLYNAWKRFMLADKQNMRFPLAFRTIGGDELTPGIDAGAYFFLQNDLGWRIRPAEEDATVLVTGNLAPEDSALPMTIPTAGAFTVLLQGLQPITQSVDSLLIAQQDANYEGEIVYDAGAGIAGTAFPIGTASIPVNNEVDMFAIAARLGLNHIKIVNSLFTADRDMIGWDIGGQGLLAHLETEGFDMTNTFLHDIDVCGDFAASSGVRVDRAHRVDALNFQGHIHNSGMGLDITLQAGETVFVRCFSLIVGTGTPVINCQDNVVDVSFRGWHGGLEITNFTQVANDMSVDLDSGRLVLGSTVTQGDIVVRGVGELEDNSAPTASVNIDGFLDASVARTGRSVINELRKLMRNKMITDPITGILTVFDDDDVGILFQANIFEDAPGLIAYRGKGAERRERLSLVAVFGPEFGPEFS